MTVFAADEAATTATETRSIMLGTSHITGGQTSNVYFGTYQQSNLGSTQPTEGTEGVDWIKSNATLNNQGPYYKIEPIKWRVLSNADGKLFLLSDQNLDLFMYHTDYEMVTWETSTMRSWLNGYGASSNIGGNSGIDYTNDNFLDTAFSASEQTAIADTAVVNDDNPDYQTEGGNDTKDKVFLLSIAEAQNYGFTNDDTRKATNTAYVAGGGKTNPNVMSGSMWFLRSPGDGQNQAATVFSNGYVSYMAVNMHIVTVRPAFNLNLSSVLFTSAASGGKADGFNATADYTGTNWKLTLLDTSRSNFTAEILKTSTKTFVSYSGATTGENEYISAMIKDANGNVTYYGRLKNVTEANGHFAIDEFDIPSKINDGDTLYIFNEQYNGDNMTDFASELKEVTIPSEINAYNVSFDANGGDGTMSELLLTSSNYTLPECTLTPPADYGFLGWSYTADGEVIGTPTITLTENITLYAKWATQHELIASLEKAVEELNAAVSSNDTDIDTINGKIDEISNKIEVLENTYATDKEVEEAIATAKSEVISAAEALVNDAKTELNAAIASKADTEAVNAAIKELQDAIDALEEVKDNYASADTALKAELESKIASAQTTLESAIDALSGELDNVKSELDKVKSELEAKDSELAQKDSELVAKDNELAEKDSELVAKDAALEKADADNKAAIEAAMNEADSANKTLGIIGLVIGCVSFVGMAAMAVFTFLIKKKQS
ncbi:MAG: InlB B-repeat-containing protein [Clostridia bacterium]|nr:InlB B-repeat-containing protein [Clostridia bacterium]